MFEIFATLCLLAQPDDCFKRWVAGGEAAQLEVCMATADAARQDIVQRFSDERYSLSVDCLPRPAASLEFKQVAPGVFVHLGRIEHPESEHSGNISNMGFIVGREQVLAIDSGGSYQTGEQLYFAIRQHTDLPLSYLVLTHMHPDHVFGASAFSGTGTKIIGHVNLSRAMADRFASYAGNYARKLKTAVVQGVRLPVVDVGVEPGFSMDIDLGGRVVRLEAWQTAHTNNDLSAYDMQSRIMFLGDLLFEQHVPVIDGSVRGWLDVMDDIDARSTIRTLVAGHGGPLVAADEGFAAQRRYFNQLIADAVAAVEHGERFSQAITHIGVEEQDNWLLFDDFNVRNAGSVYSAVEWE